MGRKPRTSPFQKHGVLVLNKPSGPTSTDCLNSIKREFKQFKIGHAGTLDPLAEGVLLVMLGQATKLGPYLTGHDKVYSGSLIIGESTDTYDIQGTVTSTGDISEITEKMVENEILAWNDLTSQEVPAYSAAKHKGRPLYELARNGEETPVKIKSIEIFDAEPLEVTLPKARFRVGCSAGTYIRSLVHSLGSRLECGAVMESLRREESRPYRLSEAHELDEVLADPDGFEGRIIPLADALPHWHKFTPSEPVIANIKNGFRIPVEEVCSAEADIIEGERAMFLDTDGNALALMETKSIDGKLLWVILRGLWG
ncbi:tRNA pseudouridine(55) synthase TruB [Maridesulfovibrio hydrothermalis]|uniref:tRNA pseudouridine synthase B n=1 Tax=Maridesulfovibrio hydrothermalis AM13 = DSM 14728 TaxID=1121451 RepID=L0RB24_9BACT|nr:tRNA pseudouridine(55) synthase TruB [Maridesulfovibrio hydrothermalis]CCO23973.1 tRNA pseudouridine synthase B [Maridesulfovibrio hydrothermalis AM13 = DSM 14728]